MKKKRILLVNNNLHIGGVQSALLALLRQIHDRYDVSLLLFYPGGELLPLLPPDVRLLKPSPILRAWGMTGADTTRADQKAARAFWAGLTRLLGRSKAIALALLFQKRLTGYDAAVSFLHSGPDRVFYGGCCAFVLRCAEAGRKIGFLHCDYEAIGGGCPENRRLYEQFDRIAACSEGCRASFLRVFPQFAPKTVTVPNCLDHERILELADRDPVALPQEGVNIVVVSRFGREKALLRAVRVLTSLAEVRKDFRCWMIGDGVEFRPARDMVVSRRLEDRIHLLGSMDNPYPWLRAADLLLIPSVSEAAPMVIGEAVLLGTPILSTDTCSARELVEAPGYGWVCENSEDGLKAGLTGLLDDPRQLREASDRLQGLRLDHSEAVRRFEALLP